MLKVIAEDFIHPDAVDTVLPLYRELVACTQREPLCLGYELFVDQKDPGHFVFIEQWPDRAALDIHCASEHFQRLVPPQHQAGRHRARQGQGQQRHHASLQHRQHCLGQTVLTHLLQPQPGGEGQAPTDHGRGEGAHRHRVPDIHGITCTRGGGRSIRARPLTG
ncbi:putative quinol monooxygenase [Stenotrophomonas sp. Sm0041]|uniref:putative quinol monooxygenase n=1 Tax=Stenotrophomonas sp. Sm0041 TaxID=3002751 RepID=UPI0027E5B01D|nr:putative quinol monooxygenase [Stenotrophomonas sp. Sm0041]MDQ7296185.1 putative quinol monooxygenase [Stenotrophomonas sp. Sm0041]